MTDNQDNLYRTGSTTPPKGHSGLVAVLLVLVIFLSGLVSILSLLNIKMFSAFYKTQQQEVPLSLEISKTPAQNGLPEHVEPETVGSRSIGIHGDGITPVYQQHFHLPEGLFITYVEEGSPAQKQDIREGDILLSLDDSPIPDEQSLGRFLEQKEPGEPCTALIYRLENKKQLSVQLIIKEVE